MNKWLTRIVIVFMFITIVSNVLYANSDFFGSATDWFSKGDASQSNLPSQANNVINIFSDMINVIGTAVIIIATIILGIKYMIGSVDSKAEVKESLITLLIACVFFFGWTSISGLLFPGNQFIFTSSTDTSYTNIVGRIFNTVVYILKFVVVGVIIYVGVRYIFAGASGKADLKGKSGMFIIGIILAFATTNVLDFISRIISETI